MIRQDAFKKSASMLKGALHCHTNISKCGRDDPDAVIRKFAENGYDFLALTDHRIYNYKNFAPGTKIIIIPGMEIDAALPATAGLIHNFHSVCLGPSIEDGNGYVQDQTFEAVKVKDQIEFQGILDVHHVNNNITFLCHPQWSGITSREFEKLSGNFAMEIWNSGVAEKFGLDNNAAYWDELLMQEIKIFGVAVDDGHNMNIHCRSWVMVNAKPEKISPTISSISPNIINGRNTQIVVRVEAVMAVIISVVPSTAEVFSFAPFSR